VVVVVDKAGHVVVGVVVKHLFHIRT